MMSSRGIPGVFQHLQAHQADPRKCHAASWSAYAALKLGQQLVAALSLHLPSVMKWMRHALILAAKSTARNANQVIIFVSQNFQEFCLCVSVLQYPDYFKAFCLMLPVPENGARPASQAFTPAVAKAACNWLGQSGRSSARAHRCRVTDDPPAVPARDGLLRAPALSETETLVINLFYHQ